MTCNNCSKCKCSDEKKLKDIQTEFIRISTNNPWMKHSNHCDVCKIDFDGPMHYSCTHPDCPSKVSS